MRYQASKTNIFSADRHSNGKTSFAKWVRENYTGQYIVSVIPYDADGKFNPDPLKNRGYIFSGAGDDHIERGLLVGKKTWFKSFPSEAEAENELDELVETGI